MATYGRLVEIAVMPLGANNIGRELMIRLLVLCCVIVGPAFVLCLPVCATAEAPMPTHWLYPPVLAGDWLESDN